LVSPEENARLHMALLYKALRSPGQEQFKGRIRISLAELWISENMPRQAKWELDRVKATYDANGWHLPKAFTEASKKTAAEVSAENPEGFYKKVEHLADDEIYSSLPEIAVTKSYHKNPDPKAARPGFGKPAVAWRVTDADGHNFWLQPHRFGIDPNLPIGTSLMICVHEGKPVNARLAQ